MTALQVLFTVLFMYVLRGAGTWFLWRPDLLTYGGVVNLYKNQGNLHIHYYGKKDIQTKAEINYTNNHGCQDIQLGK